MHSFSWLLQQGLHGSQGKGGTNNFQSFRISEQLLLMHTRCSGCIHAWSAGAQIP